MHNFNACFQFRACLDNSSRQCDKSLLRNLMMYVHVLCPHHVSFDAAGVVQTAYELFEELHFNPLPSQQQSTHSSKIELHRLAQG